MILRSIALEPDSALEQATAEDVANYRQNPISGHHLGHAIIWCARNHVTASLVEIVYRRWMPFPREPRPDTG